MASRCPRAAGGDLAVVTRGTQHEVPDSGDPFQGRIPVARAAILRIFHHFRLCGDSRKRGKETKFGTGSEWRSRERQRGCDTARSGTGDTGLAWHGVPTTRGVPTNSGCPRRTPGGLRSRCAGTEGAVCPHIPPVPGCGVRDTPNPPEKIWGSLEPVPVSSAVAGTREPPRGVPSMGCHGAGALWHCPCGVPGGPSGVPRTAHTGTVSERPSPLSPVPTPPHSHWEVPAESWHPPSVPKCGAVPPSPRPGDSAHPQSPHALDTASSPQPPRALTAFGGTHTRLGDPSLRSPLCHSGRAGGSGRPRGSVPAGAPAQPPELRLPPTPCPGPGSASNCNSSCRCGSGSSGRRRRRRQGQPQPQPRRQRNLRSPPARGHRGGTRVPKPPPQPSVSP